MIAVFIEISGPLRTLINALRAKRIICLIRIEGKVYIYLFRLLNYLEEEICNALYVICANK